MIGQLLWTVKLRGHALRATRDPIVRATFKLQADGRVCTEQLKQNSESAGSPKRSNDVLHLEISWEPTLPRQWETSDELSVLLDAKELHSEKTSDVVVSTCIEPRTALSGIARPFLGLHLQLRVARLRHRLYSFWPIHLDGNQSRVASTLLTHCPDQILIGSAPVLVFLHRTIRSATRRAVLRPSDNILATVRRRPAEQNFTCTCTCLVHDRCKQQSRVATGNVAETQLRTFRGKEDRSLHSKLIAEAGQARVVAAAGQPTPARHGNPAQYGVSQQGRNSRQECVRDAGTSGHSQSGCSRRN